MTEAELGAAWDRGYRAGAGRGDYGNGHKPRNPYTGEMNDDVYVYCPEHGGHADPSICENDEHPVEPMPDCTCGANDGLSPWGPGAYFHADTCPWHIPPMHALLPEIKVARGGIRFNTGPDYKSIYEEPK